MAAIILPRKHYTQPAGFSEADFSSGLLDRCDRLYNLNGGLRNAITGAGFASTQRPTPTPGGMGASFNGTSDFFAADTQPAHTGAFTAVALVVTTAEAGTRNIFSYGAGTAYAFQLRQANAHFDGYMAADSGTVDRLVRAANVAVARKLQFIALQWRGPNLDFAIYVNGGYGTSQVVPGQLRTASTLNIGRENAATQYWQGQILLFGWWSRALAEAELRTIEDNPWQLFRPDPVRLYSFAPVLTPTLSSPGVIDIGTTSARPQVTLTY